MSISLLLQGLFLLLGSPVHDLHLSKTDIHYNNQTSALEVTMHIFIDDLELAMQQQGMDDLFIATEREHDDADSLIQRYLSTSFEVAINGEKQPFQFLGKEESDDLMAIWCYLEKTEITELHSIAIKNSLLTEIYADQKNMVSFMGNGIKKFFLMDLGSQEAKIELR